MAVRLVPDETALLLMELARQRSEDVGRETSRFRVSAAALRQMAGRTALRTAFLEELADCVFERGWLFFSLGDRFGLVKSSAIETWPYISAKRIAPLLKRLGASTAARSSIFEELHERYPAGQLIEDEDE